MLPDNLEDVIHNQTKSKGNICQQNLEKNTQKIQGSPDVFARVTVIQSYTFTHLQYGFITCNIHYIEVAKNKMLYF